MRIQMRSQRGIIGIQTQSAQVEIDQQESELELDIVEPKLEIDSTLPKVQISQQQAFSESGLKGILQLTFENAQISRQLALGGMSRVSSQGDQLRDISKPDPVPDIARYNSWEQFKKDFTVVSMPTSGPDIDVIEGENDIRLERGYVNNKTQNKRPLVEYTPGSVNVYMQQYPKLEIWTVGSNIDLKG